MTIFFCSCNPQQKNTPNISPVENTDTVSTYRPNAMVRDIIQSRNGDILFAASRKGVFRYNGKSFTNITSKIGPRRFWNILEDSQGNLWISTTDSGVYRYDGKSFKHFTTKQGLVNNAASAVYEDRKGIIWFGTGGGVSRYDGKTFRNFTTKNGLPHNAVHTFMEDKSGRLWIGTDGETSFFDGQKFTVLRNQNGKAFTNVWSIVEDQKGNVCFGATIIDALNGNKKMVSVGLWRYDATTFTKVTHKAVSSMIKDKSGNLWTIGSLHPNGVGRWVLSRYNPSSLYQNNPNVTEIFSIEKMLCGILEANDGSIWFGSLNGVYRFDGKNIADFKDKGKKDGENSMSLSSATNKK
ncbi:two-component regulator propeller domain-containing protein [Pedobacter sp. AW1-32]|uniref:ligand-binding sensor domain-containing protein n=1 Tax=Pedobacter sp. AW1-32 TaxID=3383026 RepID=UPI003FED72C4